MQLTGDLGDFALTDILQILSLSRKTGIVSLEGAGWEAKIEVKGGRITHSSLRPGETLADSLALAGLLGADALRTLAADGDRKDSGLERLLLESGILTRNGLTAAARRHTQRVIAKLVRLEKGRFSIALGEATLPQSVDGVRLVEGLDIGEALLQAAHEQDESYKEQERQSEGINEDGGLLSLNGGRETRPLGRRSDAWDLAATQSSRAHNARKGENHDRTSLLCSLLAEMKQHSFAAEISLLIMRYASELAARGILFMVKDDKLCGLGQFGLNQSKDGKSADELVRELCLPLEADGVFARVVRTGEPFVGAMPDTYWFAELLSRVGGFGHELKLFVVPLTCCESPLFVIYGDNYPGNSELGGLGELVALASQASLALERIALQRRVMELEADHYGIS
ncbi:MAG: DUF4388 domain-containing protein [Acidobacteriota bacterium]